MRKKPHIVVFFGGDAASHDLSAETGYWVCQYLPREKYRVTPVRVTTDGMWQVPLGGLPMHGSVKNMMKHLFTDMRKVSPMQGLERLLRNPVDMFVTVLRGRNGDDGGLHKLGELLNIPVLGSDARVSTIASDKELAAAKIDAIATSPFGVRYKGLSRHDLLDSIRTDFVPPLFIKQPSQEASAGVWSIETLDDIHQAIREIEAQEAPNDWLVQEKVPGTEITLTLYKPDPTHIRALPHTQIHSKQAGYYDWWAKRRAGRVDMATNEAPTPIQEQAEMVARDIYEEMNMDGIVQMDMIVGSDEITVLDINTIPTLTKLSPLMQQLQKRGLHPQTLLDGTIYQGLN